MLSSRRGLVVMRFFTLTVMLPGAVPANTTTAPLARNTRTYVGIWDRHAAEMLELIRQLGLNT